MSVEEYRVCKTCGESKKLNSENFNSVYRVLKRTNVRKRVFRRSCKPCQYKLVILSRASSSSPEAYLRRKWNTLSRRRLKGDIEVCPSLRGRDGSAYLMELWSAQRGLCAVTGMPMTWGSVRREDVQSQGYGRVVGIDRIDGSVGYIRGNLQLVCGQVNYMRGGLSEEDFLEWCAAVVKGRVAPFC